MNMMLIKPGKVPSRRQTLLALWITIILMNVVTTSEGTSSTTEGTTSTTEGTTSTTAGTTSTTAGTTSTTEETTSTTEGTTSTTEGTTSTTAGTTSTTGGTSTTEGTTSTTEGTTSTTAGTTSTTEGTTSTTEGTTSTTAGTTSTTGGTSTTEGTTSTTEGTTSTTAGTTSTTAGTTSTTEGTTSTTEGTTSTTEGTTSTTAGTTSTTGGTTSTTGGTTSTTAGTTSTTGGTTSTTGGTTSTTAGTTSTTAGTTSTTAGTTSTTGGTTSTTGGTTSTTEGTTSTTEGTTSTTEGTTSTTEGTTSTTAGTTSTTAGTTSTTEGTTSTTAGTTSTTAGTTSTTEGTTSTTEGTTSTTEVTTSTTAGTTSTTEGTTSTTEGTTSTTEGTTSTTEGTTSTTAGTTSTTEGTTSTTEGTTSTTEGTTSTTEGTTSTTEGTTSTTEGTTSSTEGTTSTTAGTTSTTAGTTSTTAGTTSTTAGTTSTTEGTTSSTEGTSTTEGTTSTTEGTTSTTEGTTSTTEGTTSSTEGTTSTTEGATSTTGATTSTTEGTTSSTEATTSTTGATTSTTGATTSTTEGTTSTTEGKTSTTGATTSTTGATASTTGATTSTTGATTSTTASTTSTTAQTTTSTTTAPTTTTTAAATLTDRFHDFTSTASYARTTALFSGLFVPAMSIPVTFLSDGTTRVYAHSVYATRSGNLVLTSLFTANSGDQRAHSNSPAAGVDISFSASEVCILSSYWTDMQASNQNDSGLYVKEVKRSTNQAALTDIMAKALPGFAPSTFVPEYAFVAVWYKMKKTSDTQTVSFQAILITDYLVTYFVTIHQDGSPGFSIPLSPIINVYPVRVGFACRTGSQYSYDYSQLPFSSVTHRKLIENMPDVYPIYNNFVTTAATLVSRWGTTGQITYGNDSSDSSIPSHSRRGIFPYVLNSVTSHPVIDCRTWIAGATAITNVNKTKICPTALSQAFVTGTYLRVQGGYKILTVSPPSAIDGERLQCVYEISDGSFASGLPFNDGLNIYSLHIGNGLTNADYLDERTAYSQCCAQGFFLTTSDPCGEFKAMRPECTTTLFQAGSAAGANGDPHFKTLDGLGYTFNGLGEFVALRSSAFELQTRTARITTDGVLSDATVFVSVAAQQKTPAGDKVELRLNTNNDVDIIVNGNVENIDFTQFPTGKIYNGFLLERNTDSGTVYRIVFFSGIAINVAPTTPLLSISMALTADWKGTLKGLMGNYNDDTTDEFIKPDGTNLGDSTTLNEAQIFQNYGNFWRVEEADSLFSYSGGITYQSVNDESFTPTFFNANLTVMFPEGAKRTQAIGICFPGNSDDPNPTLRSQCYFDFAVLNDETLAQSTAENLQKVDETKTALANFAALFTNEDAPLQLIGGNSYSSLITLQARDDNPGDTLTFSKVSDLPAGLTVTPTGAVSFTSVPITTTSFSVKFAVSDGTLATIWEPKIKYCHCLNGGTCNFGTDPVAEKFTTIACECAAGWEGSTCNTDIDGCSDSPCFPGILCEDVIASKITTFPAGFKCDPCPTGLHGDGQSCNDIDECANKTHPVCSQNCANEVGGYTCSCNSGYLLGKDLSSCIDIDECTRGTDTCDTVATCTNTAGGFTCTCNSGYTTTLSGYMGQCLDINECSAQTSPCPANSACQNTVGSYACPCNAGYKIDQSSNTCIDIDECALQSSCQQTCVDGVNSFTCACQSGFIVDTNDNTQCVPTVVCSSSQRAGCSGGNTTTSVCALDSSGNVLCLCKSGYGKSSGLCIDVDECQTGVDACEKATCTNTDGGYTCACDTGYAFKSGSQLICEDVNECLSTHQCVSPATCVNSPGSYVCNCPGGYTKSTNGLQCTNNNECSDASTNLCDKSDALCSDTQGSYTCACKPGFAGDGFLCADLNECTQADRGGCGQGCQNAIGGHSCFCGNGYILNADGKACDDVNECSSSTTHLCYDDSHCTNKAGGYTCSCPTGFIIKADGYTCRSTSVCADDHGCEYSCNVVSSTDTCICERGYELNTDGLTCKDTNECETAGSTLCLSSNNVVCNNLPGSYSCVCTSASQQTQVESGKCIDIDECLTSPCQANAQCQNNDPGFNCTCLAGFTDLSGVCTDINECGAGTHNCMASLATCTNTFGAYTCACNTGYSGNGIQCADVNECLQGTSGCDVIAACVNTVGSYTCTCPNGYNLAADGKTCVDINECSLDTDGCGDICVNTDGAFKCGCQAGTSLAADQKTCIVTSECETSYKTQCAQSCAKKSGTDTCLCSQGFVLASDGFACTDIDECTVAPPCDQTRGVCTNTDGSYTCACSDGYKLGENNACSDRDGGLTDWGAWSTCTVTCGVGVATRTRTCTNPTVQGSGAPCSGDLSETQACTQDPCPITEEEVNNGINMTMSGMTLTQFGSIVSQFKSSVAASINSFCSLNQANARICCNDQLQYSPSSSLTFTSAANVIISPGYPTLNSDNTLQVLFVVTYVPTNALCASGTSKRRKKRSLLTGSQVFISQATLLSIIQTQKTSLVTAIIDQSEVVLGVRLPLTIDTIKRIGDTGIAPTPTDEDDGTPAWVIAVAVIGSVIAVIIIVVIIYFIIKMKSNKVESLNEGGEGEGHAAGQGHRQGRGHQQNPDAGDPRHIAVLPVDED